MLRCPQKKIDYVALGEGVNDALLTGAGLSFVYPELSGSCGRVFEDNQGTIALTASPLRYAWCKHIASADVGMR